jgi:hypothetical protein
MHASSGIRSCGGQRVYAHVGYFIFGHWHTARFYAHDGCTVAAG